MQLIESFNQIRDLPYSIPLSFEGEDNCCNGKSKRFFQMLKDTGYKVRYRVCSYLWEELPLPKEILNIPHDPNPAHVYLEVFIDNKWINLDPTWDPGLKNILPVNTWDGRSDTRIAVNPIKLFSLKESARIMSDQPKELIEEDLAKNKEFYKAFNEWITSIREKAKK